MKRIQHLLDVLSVIAGAALIAVSVLDGGQAEAATGLAMAVVPGLGAAWGVGLGSILVSMPVARRVMFRNFCDPATLPEVGSMSQALMHVGLAQRVAAANLYMADLPDEAWKRAFGDDQALWAHFGPCYAVPAIRAQMNPELRARVYAAGHGIGKAA